VAAAPNSSPLVDGSKTPELIADTDAYSLFFLTATTPTNGATGLDQARSRAFIKSLQMDSEDETLFTQTASSYRRGREQRQEVMSLAGGLVRQLEHDLSQNGLKKLRMFLVTQKPSMKLYAMPAMTAHNSGWGILEAIFSLRSVYAQSMTPFSATYTNVTVDDQDGVGVVYDTATTNAQSTCYCQSTSASTTLTSPGGRSVSASFSGGEWSQATASMELQDDDFVDGGNLQANSVHTAYCPIANMNFGNGSTAFMQQAQVKRGYYYCTMDATGTACQTYGGGSRAIYNHCVPNNFCDTLNYNIARKGQPTLFRQIQVGRVMGFCGALWNAYCDKCAIQTIERFCPALGGLQIT
jgi:hypothetical protein